MKLAHDHEYEIGHYYKRTYDSGTYIIFMVTRTYSRSFMSDIIEATIVKSTNYNVPYDSRLRVYYLNAVTTELSYEQYISIIL